MKKSKSRLTLDSFKKSAVSSLGGNNLGGTSGVVLQTETASISSCSGGWGIGDAYAILAAACHPPHQ